MNADKITSIDEYIATFPEDIQQVLTNIRATVREAAPEAEETISYQVPTFKQHGILVHFAAWKNHIGFYPSPSGIEQFEQELAQYPQSKGAVQFPYDRPIPYDLIRRIVTYRLEQNLEKQAAKKKK